MIIITIIKIMIIIIMIIEILIQAVRKYSQYIGMEFGLEKCAIFIMKSGKPQMTARNRTTKSRKNQNARRKENLQLLWNIGSRHHETRGDKRKKKRILQENEKTTRNQTK